MRKNGSCEASKTPNFSLLENRNAEDLPKHMSSEIKSTAAAAMPV